MSGICAVKGCVKDVHANGLCITHYQSRRRERLRLQLSEYKKLLLDTDYIKREIPVRTGGLRLESAAFAFNLFSRTEAVDLARWIDREITLPPGHGYRGGRKLDFGLYPHMREILSLVDNPDCRRIVLCFAAQCGKSDDLSMSDFWNSVCARPQKPKAVRDAGAIQYQSLMGGWSAVGLEIPDGVIYATAGVDVGAAELWLVLLGWGVGDRKFVLASERIERSQGWDGWDDAVMRLKEFCDLSRFNPLGSFLPVFGGGLMDSGDGNDTEAVYQFCRENREWSPAKGSGTQRHLWEKSLADPNSHYRGRYRGLPLYIHATHSLQDMLHNSLETDPDSKGGIRFAADAPDLLFAHLRNQVRTQVIKNRRETYEWHKIKSRPDHYRDALTLSILAGRIEGFHKISYGEDSEVLPGNAVLSGNSADFSAVAESQDFYQAAFGSEFKNYGFGLSGSRL